MEIKKLKNGENRYREKVYINGKPLTKTFKRKTDANAWKRQVLSERDRNQALGIELNDNITFLEFSKKWFERHKSEWQPRTQEQYSSILSNQIIPIIGHLNLKQIKLSHGNEIISINKDRISNCRIEIVIRLLKQVLKAAVDWEYIIKNPLQNLKAPKVPKKNIEFWECNEIYAFLNANRESEYYPTWILFLNTGLRKAEACGLLWDAIDLDKGLIKVFRTRDRFGLKETTKTHETRIIPINKTLKDLLLNLKATTSHYSDYVLLNGKHKPISYEHLGHRIFKSAVEAANVRPIKLKDLRSTFASQYVMAGQDIFILSKILGHKSIEMTAKKYAELSPKYIAGLKNVLEFKAISPQLDPQDFESQKTCLI